jgi:hypothetical protein
MYCWKDTNSFSTFSNTITDTSYVLLERHEQRQQLLLHNNTLVMYCWKDMNSISNLSYTLTDTRYALMERHKQHQQLLLHPN